MKDLKYLLILIGFVVFAHATKNGEQERIEAKSLHDMPDIKEQKQSDSGRIEVLNRINVIPAIYN